MLLINFIKKWNIGHPRQLGGGGGGGGQKVGLTSGNCKATFWDLTSVRIMH